MVKLGLSLVEDDSVYLIPNEVLIEHPDWLELMRMAHNKFVNQSGVDYNDGMSFLSAALTDPEHIGDDSYFFDGDAQTREGNRMKQELRCVQARYKVPREERIFNVQICEVILSGFIM